MTTYKQVRLDTKTATKLDDLNVETTWVTLKSYDEKVSFLLWFHSEYVDKT
jgi:hypothetical protein